jgi:uncharacterized glyoxalase superfamily protein PhnB
MRVRLDRARKLLAADAASVTDVCMDVVDEPRSNTLRDLIRKGTFGFGVFETADVRKTYEELKARGVQFIQEPTERPYGIEALMKDDSGNRFSLSQHKPH